MDPLFTVYVLMDPLEPMYVKYVGVTSQTLTKRLHDMMSACTKPYTVAFNTQAGAWLRSVVESGCAPLSEVKYEGHDRRLANDIYCDLINDNLETGKLTNTKTGQSTAHTAPLYDRGPSGKSANPESAHAKNSLRRKTKKKS